MRCPRCGSNMITFVQVGSSEQFWCQAVGCGYRWSAKL